MSAWAWLGRVERSMGGRTSGSGEICCEAGLGVVFVKARHCEREVGTLRQACRIGVAMVVVGAGVAVVVIVVWVSLEEGSKSRDWGLCSLPSRVWVAPIGGLEVATTDLTCLLLGLVRESSNIFKY